MPSADRTWRVDAVVTDADDRAVTDLTAADFEVRTDGKPQKLDAADYRSGHPLRIVLVADDLSLSAEHLAAVKAALHRFVAEQMQPGDEAAIVRTSAGEGALDQFTSDQGALGAAIDRLAEAKPADASPKVFSAGSLNALRSILLGLEGTPGRKAAVFFSEGLRNPERSNQPAWTMRLLTNANRSSVVVYAVNLGSGVSPTMVLQQGLAEVARETGGMLYDAGGDAGKALADVLRRQSGYYLLQFHTEGLQHMEPIAIAAKRPNVQVRARTGVMGPEGDADGWYEAPGSELRSAVLGSMIGSGMRVGISVIPGSAKEPNLQVVLHLDPRQFAVTRGLDGLYHGAIDAAVAVFGEGDTPVSQASGGVTLRQTAEQHLKLRDSGLDCVLQLRPPPQGPYQLRAAVLDNTSGRVGSVSRFLEAPDPAMTTLSLSPIQIKNAELTEGPAFAPGHPVTYEYFVNNLHRNAKNHAMVEVVSEILHGGRTIYTSPPKVIDIELGRDADRQPISGTIRLSAESGTGRFTLRVKVTDTLAPAGPRRSASQSIDFEVRP